MNSLPEDVLCYLTGYFDSVGIKEFCKVTSWTNIIINKILPLNKRFVQICILLDATASMYSIVKQLNQIIYYAIRRWGRERQVHFEYALVLYWDYENKHRPVQKLPFQSCPELLLRRLKYLHIGNGILYESDYPEAEKTAYQQALLLNWHPFGCKKNIFRFGDAPMHDNMVPRVYDVLGLLEKLYLQNDYNLHVICEKLKRKGIVVNSVCFVANEHTKVNAIMEDIMLYQNGILTTATNGVFLTINEYDSEIRRKILSFLLK